MLRLVLRFQAVFYWITGLWPLVSLASFERVTGPKTDDWLVHMVGLLAASIGVALWIGSRHVTVRPDRAIIWLGALSAASFAAIDLRYALAGQISRVYLVDAAIEILFVLLLALTALIGWSRQRPGF